MIQFISCTFINDRFKGWFSSVGKEIQNETVIEPHRSEREGIRKKD